MKKSGGGERETSSKKAVHSSNSSLHSFTAQACFHLRRHPRRHHHHLFTLISAAESIEDSSPKQRLSPRRTQLPRTARAATSSHGQGRPRPAHDVRDASPAVQHHWRCQRTSGHLGECALVKKEDGTGEMLRRHLQVKFPQFNEIVSLTLPDGTERSGQVLEARGRVDIIHERCKEEFELISARRQPCCCAGLRRHFGH